MVPYRLTEFVKTQAQSLGFIACGVTTPEYTSEAIEHFNSWLKKNYNAKMDFLSKNIDKRLNLYNFYPQAKSVLVVLINYYNEIENSSIPRLSRYALGNDYHVVISEKLKILLKTLKDNFSSEIDGKIFVDTSPVLEKILAVKAGLGWIGKNCLLINPLYGSFVFIGGIILNVELIYDKPFDKEFCGSCNKCIENCPTNALVAPRILDARKCISYLTIENKESLPEDLRNKFNGYIYGCDICQEICPWNREATNTSEPLFKANNEILKMKKEDWLKIDEKKFLQLFRNSPIKRIKFQRFKRNIDFILNS